MRLGLHIGYWGLGLTAEEQLDLVKHAEEVGFDSIWTAEAYGSDAATVLGWLTAQTTKIGIGSAIFQMSARTPAMTAMTAATLDNLSNGRFRLGLGISGPRVVEGWYGQSFSKPLGRTREYVEIMRRVLRREKLEFKGKHYEIPREGAPGKPLHLTITPVQERIPIYLATIGPKNTTLAAEIADGWIPSFWAPDRMDIFGPWIDEGKSKRSADLGDFDIAPMVQVAIGDDVDACRNFSRPFIALYVGGMGTFYSTLVGRYGFEREAAQIQELYLAGKRTEAMAAVPDELVDMTCICGPRERVAERLEAYRKAGVGTLMVTPLALTPQGRRETLETLAELA